MADEHSGNPEYIDPILFGLADDSQFSANLDNRFSLENADIFRNLEDGMNIFGASYPEIHPFPLCELPDGADVASSSALGTTFDEPPLVNSQDATLETELIFPHVLSPQPVASQLSRSQLPRNLQNRRRHRPKFSLQRRSSLEEWFECHRDY